MVIIEVNNFEKINESLGYQLSSYIIIKMANYILRKTRKVDILSRHQDDGFCILLPQTNEQGSFKKAERIRVALSNAEYINEEVIDTVKFTRRKITEHKNISVNLGVASYFKDDETINDEKDLLKKAGQALTKSKKAGENLTMAWSNPGN